MMNDTNSGSTDVTGEILADFCWALERVVLDTDNTPEVINCIINIPTSIAAILGNLLVLLSIYNYPSLHSPSHVLLFGLAMADFWVGILAQPMFVVYSIAKIKHRADIICISGTIVSSISYGLAGVSLLTLTAISLDKFLALHLHLRYRSLVTIERVIYLLVVIWVYGASAAALGPLFKDFDIVITMSDVGACLCLCLIISSYFSIFRVIRRHQKQIWQLQGQNSAVNMVELKKSCLSMFFIVCFFFLRYLPFVLATAWPPSVAKQIAFELSSTVVLAGSCLNPVVYCCRLNEMRTAVRQTLRKHDCFFR